MARTAIQPVDMADPRPRYTHGWRVGNTVYVAGQLALDKDGNLVGPNDIGAQTRRVLENMRRVLENGGASLRDVVKVTVFVTDIRYRDGYGEVRKEFFSANPPASTLVQVACLAIPGALIEIEAVAVIDCSGPATRPRLPTGETYAVPTAPGAASVRVRRLLSR